MTATKLLPSIITAIALIAFAHMFRYEYLEDFEVTHRVPLAANIDPKFTYEVRVDRWTGTMEVLHVNYVSVVGEYSVTVFPVEMQTLAEVQRAINEFEELEREKQERRPTK